MLCNSQHPPGSGRLRSFIASTRCEERSFRLAGSGPGSGLSEEPAIGVRPAALPLSAGGGSARVHGNAGPMSLASPCGAAVRSKPNPQSCPIRVVITMRGFMRWAFMAVSVAALGCGAANPAAAPAPCRREAPETYRARQMRSFKPCRTMHMNIRPGQGSGDRRGGPDLLVRRWRAVRCIRGWPPMRRPAGMPGWHARRGWRSEAVLACA
jgi:hypothetical protein